jgi:hypothetical protein
MRVIAFMISSPFLRFVLDAAQLSGNPLSYAKEHHPAQEADMQK